MSSIFFRCLQSMCKISIYIFYFVIAIFHIIIGYVPETSSYPTTAKLLFQWKDIPDGLESLLRMRLNKFESDDSLMQAFIENKAVFHKNCQVTYNSQMLDRSMKKKSTKRKADDNEVKVVNHAVVILFLNLVPNTGRQY